jgi:hypothetical protein
MAYSVGLHAANHRHTDRRVSHRNLKLADRAHVPALTTVTGSRRVWILGSSYSRFCIGRDLRVAKSQNEHLYDQSQAPHRIVVPAKQPFLSARPAGFEPAAGGLEVRDGLLSPSIAWFQKVPYLPVSPLFESVVTYRRVPLYVGPVVVEIVVNLSVHQVSAFMKWSRGDSHARPSRAKVKITQDLHFPSRIPRLVTGSGLVSVTVEA